MIVAKILEPRTGLTPASRRRIAAALGLALAAALKRVGCFEHVEVRTWRGTPDVQSKKIDVKLGNYVDVNVVDDIAKRGGWDGITITLNGEFGMVKLGVDVDVYAHEHVPVAAGIVKKGVNVLAEPRGHVGGEVVESFYELFDVEREEVKKVVEEFIAEMKRVKLKVATYTEAKTCPLWRLVANVYALRDYSFAPEEDAMPLWYRPWIRVAKDLYRLAPPGLRELAGLHGMVRVVKDAAPALLKYLTWYYDVELHGDALKLIPLSVNAHRGAVADLRDKLTWAMRTAADIGVRRIISERGYLRWEDYVKALEEELRRRLT